MQDLCVAITLREFDDNLVVMAAMDIRLRAPHARDFDFARRLYFETMRSMIERLFGWNQAHQEEISIGWFKLDEVSIITANGIDVGWIQCRSDCDEILLGSIYVLPSMQRLGIGTQALRSLLAQAGLESKALTLAVMKINPAVRLYERLGFRITHQDEYKLYMRADPQAGAVADVVNG
jgi:ribosomal protein S18 acetylase RimI-like enzyme